MKGTQVYKSQKLTARLPTELSNCLNDAPLHRKAPSDCRGLFRCSDSAILLYVEIVFQRSTSALRRATRPGST